MKDYYQVLGIPPYTALEDITKTTLEQLKEYYQNKDYISILKLYEILDAYGALNDVSKKSEYDKLHQEYFNKEKDLPVIDLWENTISDNLDFFILPKKIGKPFIGFSDLHKDTKPYTTEQKEIRYIIGVAGAILFSIIVILLAKPTLLWTIFWTIVPIALAIALVYAITLFKHINYYVSTNGFAKYTCLDQRKNLTEEIDVNFNDVTDLYIFQKEQQDKHGDYSRTVFSGRVLNKETGEILYHHEGSYDKDYVSIISEYVFWNKIEKFWTMHLLDQMQEALLKDGCIYFNLYNENNNIFKPYLEVRFGSITFIRENSERFTYKTNEIKRIYIEDNNLHIEHLDFKKKVIFSFSQSGNRDIIPLSKLCNKKYFLKALDSLVGYKLNHQSSF